MGSPLLCRHGGSGTTAGEAAAIRRSTLHVARTQVLSLSRCVALATHHSHHQNLAAAEREKELHQRMHPESSSSEAKPTKPRKSLVDPVYAALR